MTTVDVSKTGTDYIELEVTQQDSHETTAILRENLLDGSLSYHFCVTQLNVPLHGTPMFPITEAKQLFQVVRRNVGVPADILNATHVLDEERLREDLEVFNAGHEVGQFDADEYEEYFDDLDLDPPPGYDFDNDFEENATAIRDAYGEQILDEVQEAIENGIGPLPAVAQFSTYNINPQYPFYDVGDFVKDLNRWVRGFNYGVSIDGVEQNLHGGVGDIDPKSVEEASADPFEFLRISLTCDGSLIIEGFPIFWNNYMIKFTSYGAALLGIDRSLLEDDILAFTRLAGPVRQVAKAFREVAQPRNIVAANILQEIIVDTSSPIFETADQRVSISCESHLPVASNTEIIDEQQGVNRDIIKVFFENTIQTETKYDESGNYSGLSLHTKLYSGQHSMVRRSDRHNQWNRLLTSFELKYFRFLLYVTYRVWDDTAEKWKLQRKKMNIPKGTYWVMNIRFVSDS